MRFRVAFLAGAAAVLLTAVGPALAKGPAKKATQPLRFSAPMKLGKYAGGEPSLAFDPTGDGAVYVTAPQSIPAAANVLIGKDDTNGVGVWVSHDGGKTFPISHNVGSAIGGGDSDVEVGDDHTVYVADLEAIDTAVCVSHDEGRTFVSGRGKCEGVPGEHEGPENDRQWLTWDHGRNALYLTYHDFVAGFPIILKSTDRAGTFTSCGTILDPGGPAGRNYTPEGGTLVAKPVVARDGTIYVEVTEPDRVSKPVGATLDHLYIAKAAGCGPTTVWENHLVYEDPGADLGKIFNAIAVDGGGWLYVVAAGRTTAGHDTTDLWLFRSRDGGVNWLAPVKVNRRALKANVMPAVTVGGKRGEVAIGWFGTTSSGDPNGLENQWRYYAAVSRDGGRTFEDVTVTPSVVHYGDICTQGVFCGSVPGEPGNRNLADFSSIAVNPASGCLLLALPGDPWNRPDKEGGKNDYSSSTYISRQTGGRCLTPLSH